MNCYEMTELLQRRIDQQLSETELKICDNHLQQCPDCEAKLEALERISEQLNNLPKVTPRFSLVDAIMPELDRIDIERKANDIHTQAELVAVQETDESEHNSTNQLQQQIEETLPAAKRSSRFKFSWRAYSGVAAAAVVCIVFIVAYTTNNNRSLHENIIPLSAANTSFDVMESEVSDEASRMAFDDNTASDKVTRVMTQSFDNPDNKPAETQEKPEEQQYQQDTFVEIDITSKNQDKVKGTSSKDSSSVVVTPEKVVDQYGQSYHTSKEENLTNNRREVSTTGETSETANNSSIDRPVVEPPTDNSHTKSDETIQGDPGEHSVMSSIASVRSPNEQYIGVVLNDSVIIEAVADGVVLFQSEPKAGVIQNLQWGEASADLLYEVQQVDGVVHVFQIELEQFTEKLLQERK